VPESGINIKPILLLIGSADRTNTGAGTTVDTFTGVDHIFVAAFTDGFDRALGGASAATNTLVIDFVTHGTPPKFLRFNPNVLQQSLAIVFDLIYKIPFKSIFLILF
jgi:hypothetical protein